MRGRSNRIVLVDKRPPSPAEKSGKSGLEGAATIAAAALGLVGYLYALGGIVVWLRVQTAQLSPDGAIIGADNRHLLAVGARVVAFELLIVAAIALIVGALFSFALIYRGSANKGGSWDPVTLPKAWESDEILANVVGFELGLLLMTLAVSIDDLLLRVVLLSAGAVVIVVVALWMILVKENDHGEVQTGPFQKPLKMLESIGRGWLRGLTCGLLALALVIGLGVVPLLQGTILLAGTVLIYASHMLRWPNRGAAGSFAAVLVRSTGTWLAVAVLTVIALAWVATPPVGFARAVLLLPTESPRFAGAYLDRSDAGLYLGLCTRRTVDGHLVSKHANVRLIPTSESERLRIGGRRYSFDPGGRPSLWQILNAMVGGGNAATESAPLRFPLRGRQSDICGEP